MRDRTGWTRGHEGPVRIGTKTYKDLVEYSRPCAACQKSFSIFVTKKIAEGLADSNNFGLKNCEAHRRGAAPVSTEEIESLRSKDRVMSDELSGLYAVNKELSEQVESLKSRLAQYELQPALVALKDKMPWQ